MSGKALRILIGCESSGVVRRAFRALGHEAWSCDIKPAEDGSEHHLQGNVLGWVGDGWDMLIAHPECTHLCVSGALHFPEKIADGRQQAAIDFFMAMVNAPIERIAIENPVGIMSTKYRKPDQIVQPYWFGDDASKKTCLWLKGLPLLVPTNPYPPRVIWDGNEFRMRWDNQCDSGQNRLGPSEHRSTDRSRTYLGLALAMAYQWAGVPEKAVGAA